MLCTGACCQQFTQIISFNSDNPTRQVFLLLPFYRWGNSGTWLTLMHFLGLNLNVYSFGKALTPLPPRHCISLSSWLFIHLSLFLRTVSSVRTGAMPFLLTYNPWCLAWKWYGIDRCSVHVFEWMNEWWGSLSLYWSTSSICREGSFLFCVSSLQCPLSRDLCHNPRSQFNTCLLSTYYVPKSILNDWEGVCDPKEFPTFANKSLHLNLSSGSPHFC